jgi:hypothetical protein
MTTLILVLLAQTASLNLNMQPIEVRDEGVRQGTTRAYAINCSGTGVTCTNSAGVMTMSVAGGGGGGAPTSATYITQTSDATLTNEQALSSLSTGLVSVTTGTGVLSNYAGATCGANQFATQVSAAGALTCGQPAFSDLSGTATTAQLPTITVAKGGTGQTTVAANQVFVGTAADTLAAKTLPSCSNSTTSKLLFDNSTQTWSCGTDQTGGGGGGASPYLLAFGGF